MECRRYVKKVTPDSSVAMPILDQLVFEVLTFGIPGMESAVSLAFHPKKNTTATDMQSVIEVDAFCWWVEGVFILIIGIIGLLGNSLSVIIFSRQDKHKIFHNLLLTLTIFDLIYVVCSILLFSISKFNHVYDTVYRLYLLPYLLPLAHVGLTGSVYCTLSMTTERYLAVHHPFMRFSHRAYKSRTFIAPVVVFTLLYNIPKFFELTTQKRCPVYYDKEDQGNINTTTSGLPAPLIDDKSCNMTDMFIDIQPTELRTNRVYIRVYILWMNLIIHILIPFILLIILNVKIYRKIKEFESNLKDDFKVFYKSQTTSVKVSMLEEDPQSGEESKSSQNTDKSIKRARDIEEAETFLPDQPESIERLQNDDLEAGNEDKVKVTTPSRNTSFRRREVKFAKISLYIVFVFLICHGVRLFPNTFEMIETYMEDYNPDTINFPIWMYRVTNLSHFLLAFVCSANFFIYFAKHGHNWMTRNKARKKNTSSFKSIKTTEAPRERLAS